MTLTIKEMQWYKQHQVEIENVIDDDVDLGNYFDHIDKGDLTWKELYRVIFYILYNAKGVDGFYTLTCGEDDDVFIGLMPGSWNSSISCHDWANEFYCVFGIDGVGDEDSAAYYISKGVELEELTKGIREEVAKCFEECYNDYDA